MDRSQTRIGYVALSGLLLSGLFTIVWGTPRPGYMQRQGDCYGYDIIKMADTDLGPCLTSCSKAKACMAVMYNTAGRYCFLKTKAGCSLVYKKAVSLQYFEKTETNWMYNRMSSTPSSGVVRQTMTSLGSEEECALYCFNDGPCSAFGYDSSTVKCYLVDTKQNTSLDQRQFGDSVFYALEL